jgi:hypothetical protein
MDFIILVVIFLVGMPVLVVVSVYKIVVKMSEPEKMMQPMSVNQMSPDRQQIVAQHRDWLGAQGYHFLTNFRFGTIDVAVFQQTNAPRFFNLYFHQTVSYDLISRFSEADGLTTATSKSVGMFPRMPGQYKQSFPGASADAALQRHYDAEAWLVQRKGIQWQQVNKSYEQCLVDVMRREMQFVRAIPLWPVRSLYWYAFMRGKMANVSIQQQYP